MRVPLDGQSQVGADLFGDPRVVAGGDLDLDAQRRQPASESRAAAFGLVEEHQEAGQRQVASRRRR